MLQTYDPKASLDTEFWGMGDEGCDCIATHTKEKQ